MSEVTKEAEAPEPIRLTLLLVTGMRVSLNLSQDFIAQYELSATTPGSIGIASLKSALFTSWKDEWGTAPVSAANIRLIHYGKVLEESQTIEVSDAPHNVVHMSVKPASFELESSSKPAKNQRGGLRRSADTEADRAGGSHCCVVS